MDAAGHSDVHVFETQKSDLHSTFTGCACPGLHTAPNLPALCLLAPHYWVGKHQAWLVGYCGELGPAGACVALETQSRVTCVAHVGEVPAFGFHTATNLPVL